jgi:DNA-binding Lrp family transcriptional regulator
MATAYLKVWVEVGKETAVREALKKIRGVKRCDLTTGDQDIIVLIEAGDYQSLLDTILTSVRSVQGIERTITNLVLE